MKAVKKICAIIASVCFLLFTLLSLVDILCFSHSFYAYEYEKNDQAEVIGMSDENLLKSTDALLDYLKGRREDISIVAEVNGISREVFDERESLHMVDVRTLYDEAMSVRNICGLSSFLLFLWIVFAWKKDRYAILKDGFENGLFMVGCCVLCILIWAIAEFNNFWLDFHYLFFDNDLFLLDPAKSIMINMFPESFFFDLVLLIIVSFAIVCLTCYFAIRKFERKEAAQ